MRADNSVLEVPVLATALIICRKCLPLNDVEKSLSHVVSLLDQYLNPFSSLWTVANACRVGLPRRALEYLTSRGAEWGILSYDPHLALNAVRNGYLHVLQWLHECHLEMTPWSGSSYNLLEEAAYYGRLEVLKWLHGNRDEGTTTEALDMAAAHGYVDVVKWLHEHRSEGCTAKAMDLAAAYGHLPVVTFLHEKRHEGCTSEAMRRAALSGHLEVVQWLHTNRSEGDPGSALRRAAKNGHAAVVLWLCDINIVRKQRGGGSNSIREAIQIASETGHLIVAKQLEYKFKRPSPENYFEIVN